jgi:hypothetical protein
MAKLTEFTKPTAFSPQEPQFLNKQCLYGIKFPRDSIVYMVGGEFEARNSRQHAEVVMGSIIFKDKDKIKTCLQKVKGVIEFENADIHVYHEIACIELRTFMHAGIMVH